MALPAGQPSPREITVVRAREARAALQGGLTVPEIARREGVTEQRVRQWLKMPHLATSADATPATPDANVADAPPRLAERTVTVRAVAAMRSDSRFRRLTDTQKVLWLEAVIAIRTIGDGVTLIFEGSGFDDEADFVWCLGDGSVEDLTVLFRRGLLGALEGGAAMPSGLGLRPEESRAGRRRRAAETRPDPVNPSFLFGLEGGQGNARASTEGNLDENSGQTFSRDGENIFVPRENNSGNIPEIEENIFLARDQETTTTTTKESESLGGSSSSESRATSKISGDENVRDENVRGENFHPPHVALAAELAVLMGHSTQPKPADVNHVQGLLAEGLTPERLRDECRGILGRPKPPAHISFGYLAKVARDKPRAAPAPATPAPATLSAEDQALIALLKPATDAYASDKGCPFPPGRASFNAALAAGHGPVAHRWLAAWDGWNLAGRPGRARPPDFTALERNVTAFEADLADCEEELTAPDATTGM